MLRLLQTKLSQSGKLESLFLLHFSVAFAAVHRSVVAGLERNQCLFTALETSGGEEFSLGLASVFALITASLASLRLILEALFCIEFLFTGSENELVSAVLALQCDVLIHDCFTSLCDLEILPKGGFTPPPLKPELCHNALFLSYTGI